MSPPDMHVFLAGTGFLSRSRPETDSLRVLTVVDRLATGELVVTRGGAFRAVNELPEPGVVLPDTVVHGLRFAAQGESRGRVTWLPSVRYLVVDRAGAVVARATVPAGVEHALERR